MFMYKRMLDLYHILDMYLKQFHIGITFDFCNIRKVSLYMSMFYRFDNMHFIILKKPEQAAIYLSKIQHEILTQVFVVSNLYMPMFIDMANCTGKSYNKDCSTYHFD